MTCSLGNIWNCRWRNADSDWRVLHWQRLGVDIRHGGTWYGCAHCQAKKAGHASVNCGHQMLAAEKECVSHVPCLHASGLMGNRGA